MTLPAREFLTPADDGGFRWIAPRGSRLIDCMRLLRMASSNKDAKRLIESGGVRVNDVPEDDPARTFGLGKFYIRVGSGQGLTAAGGAKFYLVETT